MGKRASFRMKRIISAGLAFVMLATSIALWPETAHASLQTPVSDLTLQNNYVEGKPYALSLHWTEPEESNAPDTSAVDDPSKNKVQGYNVYYTKGRVPRFGIDTKQAMLADTVKSWDIPASSLESGSVYAFAVEPYHLHSYIVYYDGYQTTQQRYAPLDTGKPATNYELFMTDLIVTASGAGGHITVTWDRPMFDNKPIFDRYYIYYGLGAARLENPAVVLVSDPALKVVNGKYVYTITKDGGGSFELGEYEVRVEPMTSTGNSPLNRADEQYLSTIDRYVWLSRNKFTARFMLNPSLYVVDADSENIRIYWDSLQTVNSKITKLIIERSTDPNFSNPTDIVNVLTIENDSVAKMTTETYMKKPGEVMYFRMRIIVEETGADGKPISREYPSDVVRYDPTQAIFTPTKPIIVSAVPNGAAPVNITLTWEAFTRLPYTKEEIALAAGKKEMLDENIRYVIWVTDDVLNFSDPNFYSSSSAVLYAGQDVRVTGPDASGKYYYDYQFSNYMSLGSDGQYVSLPLTDNKIYYFRIVAERTQVELSSEYGYYSCFVKPIGDVNIAPIMLSRPPLRVKTVGGVEVIDQTSITVEWETSWYEVYDWRTDNWYSRFDFNSGLLFGNDVSDASSSAVELLGSVFGTDEQKGIASIQAKLQSMTGMSDADLANYPVRYMSLAGSQYDIAVVPYSKTSESGFEAYVNSLNSDASVWKTITPVTGSNNRLEYKVTATTSPAGSLTADTSYIILVRPFTMKDGVKLTAHYPAYVIASTLADRPPIVVVPTVPALTVVDVGYDYVTVKFKYVAGLSYELAYSETQIKGGTGEVIVSNETLLKDGKITGPDAKGDYYMEYTVIKLFPETTYYFWARTTAKNAGGDTSSVWSNPVNAKTKDITPPSVPQGLGLASESHVDTYNKKNKTEYLPIDVEYIIVEWYKNVNDALAAGASNTEGAELLLLPDFPDTYMAMFDSLTGNKPYWFRIKARLTVTKTADGSVAYYQYIVQMSPTESFVDVIELTVPNTLTGLDAVYTRSKESAWSTPVKLITGRYKGEYDGDKNPNLYPLPEKDFETIYDKTTDTLTLRFLSDKVDANGNHDNLADQRFISSLIASKTYDYNVNIAFYNGKPVKNRRLELPYQIVKAFAERKITLTITTDTSVYKLPPSFFETTQLNALKNLGTGSSVIITVNNDTTGLPALNALSQGYASPAQKLSISVATQNSSVRLSYTKSPASIALLLSSRYITLEKNTGSYTFRPEQNIWDRNKDSFDKTTNELKFTTSFISAYSAIANNVPVSIDSSTADEMYDVATKLELRGLSHYDPKAAAPALYLNKIIAALAKNSLAVNVTESLTDDEYNSLSKAGMLVTGGNVTREAGIAALVKLYETKTKTQVKSAASESSTSYTDIKSADAKYKAALLKAAEIGFLEGDKARPKDNLTMAEMIRIFNIIIKDSGM